MVPLPARGTRAELDALPVRSPTRVPRALGLPALPGNVAEGLVLRPDTPLEPARRPVLKRKIDEFDERRFDQSRPWDPHTLLTPGELRDVARSMVNGPRLASARSKVGPAAGGELLDEVLLDVMIDLTEAFPAAVAALGDAAEADLRAVIRAAAEEHGGGPRR
ncbi:hypothetical protein ACFOWE_29320 [Planomonospora corallina]|uniref:Uncharacterized protein n=1 Tax=Planomonospora corallina TaxID=1806052 RepID=A0ABV8IEW7_9ACTN